MRHLSHIWTIGQHSAAACLQRFAMNLIVTAQAWRSANNSTATQTEKSLMRGSQQGEMPDVSSTHASMERTLLLLLLWLAIFSELSHPHNAHRASDGRRYIRVPTRGRARTRSAQCFSDTSRLTNYGMNNMTMIAIRAGRTSTGFC